MKTQDFLGCVGGAFIILYIASLFPLAGPFIALATPLIFLYYLTKLGRHAGLMLIFLTLVVVGGIASFSGSPRAFILCLEFSIMGISLSEGFRRGFSLGHTVFFATSLTGLVVVGYLLFLGAIKGMGPLDLVRETLRNHLKPILEIHLQAGATAKEYMNFQDFVDRFIDVFSMIFPSLMIVGTGFAVWLNILLARPLFRMANLPYPEFIPFERWRAPEGLVWGIIVSGFSLFLPLEGIQFFAINVVIILLTIYLFHGLAIVQFFLRKYHTPSWMRAGVYSLLVFQQIFLGLLALAGLFDQWFDFRKIQKEMEE